MESKIMQVFYGNDCLPYKDKARTVHYPIVGSAFVGANNTTQIRFYVKYIGGTTNVSWVATTKLPNGQIGNEVLSNPTYDSENNEYYLPLDLSSFYTSQKGEIYIALNGYQGGVNVEQDEDTGIYEISGTPTIQATGCVKIAINYAPQTLQGTIFEEDQYQQLLGAISDKLNITNGIIVVDFDSINYNDFEDGQMFLSIEDHQLYILNNGEMVVYESPYMKQWTYNDYKVIEDIIDDNGLDTPFLMNYNNVLSIVIITESSNEYTLHLTNINGKYDSIAITNPNSVNLGTLYSNGNLYKTVLYSSSGVVNLSSYSSSYPVPTTGNEMTIIKQDNAVVYYQGSFFNKGYKAGATYYFFASNTYIIQIGGSYLISQNQLTINESTGDFDLRSNAINVYDKTQTDSALALKQDTLTFDSTPTAGSSNPVTSAGIRQAIDSAVSSAYIYKGTLTVSQVNALDTSTLTIGWVYNISTYGTITLGNIDVNAGDNIAWTGTGWDLLSGFVDLSNYVQKTTTIAGNALTGNISAQTLTDSLVFMNNTTDIDYVMGE